MNNLFYNYNFYKRIIDLILSLILIIAFIIPMIIIYFLILFIDNYDPLYFSKRIGKNNIIFLMPKFRTMNKNTQQIATHLFDSHTNISKLGKILRITSLDEMPQLFSIFFGSMSFIGPRPALYNQKDLINLRTKKNIHKILPGLTGLAQVNGRDSNSIEKKVLLDEEYLKNKSFVIDMLIIFKTIKIIFLYKNIKH